MRVSGAEQPEKPGPAKVWAAALLMLALPPLVCYLWICVAHHEGALFLPSSWAELQVLLTELPAPTGAAVLLLFGWLCFQALLQIVAPGKTVAGVPLADGTCLRYKLNGWVSFCVTLVLLILIVVLGGARPGALYEHLGPLLITTNIFAFVFSLLLYVRGKRHARPAKGAGNFLYDYFAGVDLNPRVGTFDIKFFCESRPGLIGWMVINLVLAGRQYELHGTVGTPMILVLAFQFLYIADYFWHEEAILTTWDIKHERFGWMLCWGDLVWVPFTYTLQAHYLVQHSHDLPIWGIAALVGLNLTGYWIFRGANLQKHRFRKDPAALVWGKAPESIETDQGTRLLVSGWWGLARHANYLGDLLMALAWCLPCLFQHPLPYFYFIYFVILLLHRERRDHNRCLAKYGTAWQKYCQAVPWRMAPGIY
jgi:delta14-sterol reductase